MRVVWDVCVQSGTKQFRIRCSMTLRLLCVFFFLFPLLQIYWVRPYFGDGAERNVHFPSPLYKNSRTTYYYIFFRFIHKNNLFNNKTVCAFLWITHSLVFVVVSKMRKSLTILVWSAYYIAFVLVVLSLSLTHSPHYGFLLLFYKFFFRRTNAFLVILLKYGVAWYDACRNM